MQYHFTASNVNQAQGNSNDLPRYVKGQLEPLLKEFHIEVCVRMDFTNKKVNSNSISKLDIDLKARNSHVFIYNYIKDILPALITSLDSMGYTLCLVTIRQNGMIPGVLYKFEDLTYLITNPNTPVTFINIRFLKTT
jgi:hypothetical protein